MNNDFIPEDLMKKIVSDRAIRRGITRQNHLMFFHVYFPNYVKYPVAEFHKDIFRITEDQSNNLACIVAFRGSGKSTLVTFSYSLWAILGVQEKKFVLIICQTQAQAKQHMANLRYELETNRLLKSDLGPFHEDATGEWGAYSVTFSNTGSRITIASIDQSIRGIRHHEHRPDLIILDDIEDLNSTKTIEGRNKIFDWFAREVVPLGDLGTRIVAVGNLLHEDSLMMRLRRKIEDGELKGVFKWFPILNEHGDCLWPGKFDTKEKIENLRQSVADEIAWQQEYLLKIVSSSSRAIYPEWIQYHDCTSVDDVEGLSVYGGFMGVDLAISQSASADYTAIVSGVLCRYNGSLKFLVMPNPVNSRMTFHETIANINSLIPTLRFSGCFANPVISIETNGFQEIFAQFLRAGDVADVKGMKNTVDKRSRLTLTSTAIQEGFILFPKEGADDLIAQLTGFGRENHDDLADAFVMMYLGALERIQETQGFDSYMGFVERNGGSMFI